MRSGCDHYAFSFLQVFNVLLACNGEVVYLVACKRLTESLPLAELLLDGVTHNFVQIFYVIAVRIGIAIREVYCIVGVLEIVLEGVCEESSLASAFIRPAQSV